MSQLELDSRFVKRGYWVNLSGGPVMGQTITTDSKTGGVIVALLAVLTSLGMTHLWHLFTFFYHQVRANGRPADGLFRHQQALLRTLPTPSSLMADSLKLWYAWKGASDHALARSMIHVSVALLFAIGSLTVSIFSSSIVSTTNLEVLVNSPHCGLLDTTGGAYWDSYTSVNRIAAELYSPYCYRDGVLPSSCNSYSRPNIKFETEHARCPFDDKICATPAISFDSGLLDLNDAFGMNLENANRIRYRRKSTCAVLSLDGYTRLRNATLRDVRAGRPIIPGEQIIEYLYGTVGNTSKGRIGVSTIGANVTRQYTMLHTIARPNQAASFTFIPEMQREDADVSLRLTIKGSMNYATPVNDPLFAAHRPWNPIVQTGINRTSYLSDSPASAIGCAQQYQYCIDKDTCTELGGLPGEPISESIPKATKLQSLIIELLVYAAWIQDLSTSHRYEAGQISAQDGYIMALPDDQWIKEMKSWESGVWASHQITIADYAIGPTVRDPLAKDFVLSPSSKEQKTLCRMQKMRKPGGFVNLNFFGFIFTIAVSVTIVILDLILLRFLLYLRNYQPWLGPRVDRWLQDGIFQLQRRAHEAQGNGVWKDLTEEVPVTSDKSALLDLLLETIPTPQTPPNKPQSMQEHSETSINTLRPQSSNASALSHQTQGQDSPLDDMPEQDLP